MKKVIVLCFFSVLFSSLSCNKDENPTTGYADKIVGTYHGTMYHGGAQLSCISDITKTGDTKVNLTIILGGSSFSFGEIAVYPGADNTYIINYTDPSGYLNGKVDGSELTYSINSGVLNDIFTGYR